MIQRARENDITQVMEIVWATIREMHQGGNFQWDEAYPAERDFIADIENGNLFVARQSEKMDGFICINTIEPKEYETISWSAKEALVLHRMAVEPEARKNGTGAALLSFAEALAKRANIDCLKTDTYSLNEKAQRLFIRTGYAFMGEMRFRGRPMPFYCYEKLLTQTNDKQKAAMEK